MHHRGTEEAIASDAEDVDMKRVRFFAQAQDVGMLHYSAFVQLIERLSSRQPA